MAPPEVPTPRLEPPDAEQDRVIAVFSAVVALAADERPARLRELCAGDTALLRAVEDLLRAHDDPSPVLRSLVEAGSSAGAHRDLASTPASNNLPPTTIGPYEVVDVLGRGGMGIVYRAVQKKPRRTVALKVLSPARLDVESVVRFEREIEVLGLLQHPGICRIYDAGAVDLGLGLGEVLYFAMELIDGVSLSEFVVRQRLDVRGRCALIAQIGEAVQHAHRRGVVHRDLKPTNILVVKGSDGMPAQPKVLDFGIARSLDAEPRPATQTRTGALLGTLQYMSPEQLSGQSHSVDTRTDIYSLGVILYELLAGRPPLALHDLSLTETCRVVTEREPTPLGRVDKGLRGDVEVIVAKALAKQREDRYGSAAELVDDLRRFVRGEPILAKPQTTLYHVRRFARRHRTLVGGVLATLLVLLAGLIAVAILARNNRTLANQEAAARTLAESTSERLRHALYSAQMRLCSVAFIAPGGVARARDVLSAWQPHGDTAAHSDLRGFEWYLLHALGHEAAAVRPCETTPFDLTWLPAGDSLFSSHWHTAVFTDVRSGEITQRFDANVAPLTLSAVAADRSVLVQSTTSQRLAALDPSTRGTLATFDHDSEVLRCLLSPDGALLAVNTADGVVVMWQTRTGRRLFTVAGRHSAPLAFSRDGALFAAARHAGMVRVWRTGAWEAPLCDLRDLSESLLSVSFDARGKLLATGGHEGWLRVFDLTTGAQTAAIPHPAALRRVAFAPDEARVAVACEDYAAYVHDLDTKAARQLSGHAGIVATVAWSPDGKQLATMSDDRTLRLWNPTQPPTVRTFSVTAAEPPFVQQLVWNQRGDEFAVRIPSGTHATFAVGEQTHDPTPRADFVLAVGGAAFTARLEKGGQIVVTPNSSAPNARTYALAADGCQRLAASPTAPVLAIGARNELRLWHFLQAGSPVTIATIDVCRGLAWRADGRAVALVDGSDVVTVFDATSGERLASRTFPEGALGLDCAPQGDAIAVACVDQVVRIWSPTRGLLGKLVGHASHVQAVAYSPDGSRIASGGQDRTVKIFAVDDATELLTLPHDAHVGAVAWSPNGRRLASVDVSGQVKVWDATAGYAANSR